MTAPAAAVGVVLDRVLGEPPTRWHPVVGFAGVMNAFEARWWADDRRRGLAHAAVGTALGAVPAMVLRRVVGASVATAATSGAAIAGAMLEREARGVGDALLADDLDGARRALAGLVGRRTDELDVSDVARAVIETVAENTVDAVTATLFWASVGGSVGALVHRAINTMDAMVGHRTARHERFGWASARLDDAVNWIPARLTVAAVMIASPSRAADVWRTVRRDAAKHPSPNGGVVEAAFAASLGLRLGGTNVYDGVAEDRGLLGDGRPPVARDIARSVTLARRVTWVFVVVGVVVERGVRRAASGSLGRDRRRD